MMRAHYLQHVPFEGLGCVEPWLISRRYEITCTRFFNSTDLPSVDEVDLLVVMGGPMSVNDDREFPWLDQEKAFIRRCVEADMPVLGICLGAQLIVGALGRRVYRNHTKEIGWFPIASEPETDRAVFRFPPAVEVFHWHGETFDLPEGAVRLASSVGCRNQAFQLGPSVVGLQFHLEVTPETVQALVHHCGAELENSPYVQSETAMLAAPPDAYAQINRLMGDVLSFLCRKQGQNVTP